jgi:flagellar biosynthesis/type III secretory pathway protein FliH
MHRLVFFDETVALEVEGWRLRPSEVADLYGTEQILDRCRRRSEEVERLRAAYFEKAKVEGFAQGVAEGQAVARREAAAQLTGFFRQWSAERARNRAAVGRLTMMVVRRLLGEIGETRTMELFVHRCFEELKEDGPLRLHVPPAAKAGVDRWLGSAGTDLKVAEEPTLAPDECAFEFGSGVVHASLRLELDALERMVAEVEASSAQGEACDR